MDFSRVVRLILISLLENLQPFQRVAPAQEYVILDIHPEGQDHVYNDGGAHGEERNVNEPQPYT